MLWFQIYRCQDKLFVISMLHYFPKYKLKNTRKKVCGKTLHPYGCNNNGIKCSISWWTSWLMWVIQCVFALPYQPVNDWLYNWEGFCLRRRVCVSLCFTGSTEIHSSVLGSTQLWNMKRWQTSPITTHIISLFEFIFNSQWRKSCITNKSHITFPGRLFVPLDHIKIWVWMAAVYQDIFTNIFDKSSRSLNNTVFWEFCGKKDVKQTSLVEREKPAVNIFRTISHKLM